MGHVQGYCNATQEARIACHNRCRELVTSVIRRRAAGWVTFPEATCTDTLNIIYQVAGISLPSMPPTLFWDPKDSTWRVLDWEEASAMRVDELAINTKAKCVWHNEMTQAWDSQAGFKRRKDEFKTAWYQPWINHLSNTLTPQGWSVQQLNFTMGVRATIQEDLWLGHLDAYAISPLHQETLFQSLADTLMSGALEIMQAYKSHQWSRIDRAAQAKTTRKACCKT
eukprot:2375817-Rhodomonas_salina.1